MLREQFKFKFTLEKIEAKNTLIGPGSELQECSSTLKISHYF